ncbi:MAG: hypothetical protein KIS68_00250 [Bauldia sp.]|nr:hypothetical protein [Bauldia sp.]
MRRSCGFGLVILAFLAALEAGAQEIPVVTAEPEAAGEVAATLPADPAPVIGRNSFSLMVGLYTTSFWARSFSVNEVGYEPNFVIALISGRDLITTPIGFRVGHESGIALRFGQDFSVEMWRAVTFSFGARLLGRVMVTPQFALGLSSVSNLIGVERPREAAEEDGDMSRLIYNGSQLAWLLEAIPFIEVFYRLHHRSGALGFWGNVPDGHNANAVGFQIRY